MINKEFPWIHIVKGKPRKPSTQGSVEVSHNAFKKALVKWLDKEKRENPTDRSAGQDWILGATVVQCEINNAPIKVHNHMTPHMVYCGKVNKHSYSALLGKAPKGSTDRVWVEVSQEGVKTGEKDRSKEAHNSGACGSNN